MIEVLSTGTDCRIVDMGRSGRRHQGIPISGAMDTTSAISALSILGLDTDQPLVEIYGPGASFKFLKQTKIAIVGAKGNVLINDQIYSIPNTLTIEVGQTLKFVSFRQGLRCYLAIPGLIANKYLNSYCSLLPYFDNRLKRHQIIQISEFESKETLTRSQSLDIDNQQLIYCKKGPEFEFLNPHQQKSLLQIFTLSKDCNNMGYRLMGDPIKPGYPTQILSSAVLPGTVQLIPNGQLIILMRDCQTTGGYPRVLQVEERSISQLAQRGFGHSVKFDVI